MPTLQTVKSILEWVIIVMKAGQVVIQGAIEAIKLYEASATAGAAVATATVTASTTRAMATTAAIAG